MQSVMQFIVSVFTAASLHSAELQPAGLPLPHQVPGGVALVDLGNGTEAPQATFNGKAVMVRKDAAQNHWQAVVGIPLKQAPGEAFVAAGGQHYPFAIRDKAYPEQHLTVKNKHVNPNEEQLNRIRSEFARMGKVYTSFTDGQPWQPMIWPAEGPLSSAFGLKRFFNGEQRNPHSGLDIAAPTGSNIRAPSAGTVVLTGDFYFNGNSVFLDHGHGLISMFCHMQGITVQEGDQVQAGDLLGTVGATGRATGPHLHWTVSLNNARINPLLMLAHPGEAEFSQRFTAATGAEHE